jgi:hypothetical protein
MAKIQALDKEGEGVDEWGWSRDKLKLRVELEKNLEEIMGEEELYWQQRSGEKAVLEGEDNPCVLSLAS